jgi:hypothetical protein
LKFFLLLFPWHSRSLRQWSWPHVLKVPSFYRQFGLTHCIQINLHCHFLAAQIIFFFRRCVLLHISSWQYFSKIYSTQKRPEVSVVLLYCLSSVIPLQHSTGWSLGLLEHPSKRKSVLSEPSALFKRWGFCFHTVIWCLGDQTQFSFGFVRWLLVVNTVCFKKCIL